VSSSTGDRTRFTYGAHTLVEPGFLALIRAYRQVFPLSGEELRFLPEVYRFFILNYVVREGARFFREDLCQQFRRDAVRTYLPTFETFDFSPLFSPT
jgi:Ser/Thr protein kinase RdoA (MazF antagonist)